MKVSTAIALVFVVLVLGFFLRARYEQAHQFKTAGQFTQWMAAEAVKDARENNHIDLD